MGHAMVYKWYKDVLKGTGQVTLNFANNVAMPQASTNSSHVEAALRYQDFIVGIEGNPLPWGRLPSLSPFHNRDQPYLSVR